MTAEALAQLAEEHVRAALHAAEADFPAFDVDSWSEPAVPGQHVLVSDDEGRTLQARLDHRVARGVAIEPGSVARPCGSLVRAVVAELRGYVAGGGLIVSRPLPDPEADSAVLVAHLEVRGLWLRLIVGHDAGSLVAVLAAVLGRGAVPLVEPEESVVWL